MLDSGVLVSAALTEGAPRELVRQWYDGRFVPVVNRQLLYELEKVLLRRKFRRYVSLGEVVGYVTWLHERAETGHMGAGQPPRYTGDPDDDYLMALAKAAGVDYLISGDQHLLDLGKIGDRGTLIQVLTPRAFLEEIGE